jgi:hypothetical protein
VIEEDDDDDGTEEVKSFQVQLTNCQSFSLVDKEDFCLQEQEMEKQKLLYEQNRLANRGAAETVLLYISASKGLVVACGYC